MNIISYDNLPEIFVQWTNWVQALNPKVLLSFMNIFDNIQSKFFDPHVQFRYNMASDRASVTSKVLKENTQLNDMNTFKIIMASIIFAHFEWPYINAEFRI